MVAAAGLVAVTMLAVPLVNANGQLKRANTAQATTQGQLAKARAGLARANQEVAARKALGAYLQVYFTDDGRILQDQSRLNRDCDAKLPVCGYDFSAMQSDFQTFQDDRSHASAPATVSAADAQLGAALSQYITAFRELNLAHSPAELADAQAKLTAAQAAFATAVTEVGAALGTQSSPV